MPYQRHKWTMQQNAKVIDGRIVTFNQHRGLKYVVKSAEESSLSIEIVVIGTVGFLLMCIFSFIEEEVKIGRPGYRVTKQFDPETKQRSLLFQELLIASF